MMKRAASAGALVSHAPMNVAPAMRPGERGGWQERVRRERPRLLGAPSADRA